jgi:hypothetical protein
MGAQAPSGRTRRTIMGIKQWLSTGWWKRWITPDKGSFRWRFSPLPLLPIRTNIGAEGHQLGAAATSRDSDGQRAVNFDS